MSKKTQTPKTQTKKAENKVKKETLVYCGPSFPGELDQYSVFKNGLPKFAEKHIEDYPLIRSLFVSLKDFPKTKRNITISGKKENQLYNKVLQHQKEAK